MNRSRKRSPFLLFLGGFYALLAVVFIFFPGEFIYLINVGPKVFKVTEAIPDAGERFWSLIAGAGAAMFSALCLLSAESPAVRGYVLVQMLGSVICFLGFASLFMNQQRYFAYLLGGIASGLIAIATLWNEFANRSSSRHSRDLPASPPSPLPNEEGPKL